MLSPRQLAAGLRLRPTAVAVPRVSEGAAVASIAFVVYLVVAAILAIGLNFVVGDAWSRITNAYYVLFSRDPHLAAIGFVGNPLPFDHGDPVPAAEGHLPAADRSRFHLEYLFGALHGRCRVLDVADPLRDGGHSLDPARSSSRPSPSIR